MIKIGDVLNMLVLDPGTMAGMTDEHFIASVEPLLMTPLERELFKRFADVSLAVIDVAGEFGLDDPDDLRAYLEQPECPSKDVIDELVDDALYLSNMFADDSDGYVKAEELKDKLLKLQGELK